MWGWVPPPEASPDTFVCPEMDVSDQDKKVIKIRALNFEKQKHYHGVKIKTPPQRYHGFQQLGEFQK